MNDFNAIKAEYLNSIKSWGYKVAYDAQPNHQESNLFDLELLCIAPKVDDKPRYAMYQIAPTNELAVMKYKEYKDNGKLNEFKDGFLKWIGAMTFNTNDMVACLLIEGYDIEKVWVDNKIHLTPSIIKVLINSLCSKGSPL